MRRTLAVLILSAIGSAAVSTQQLPQRVETPQTESQVPPVATFKSSVDLVRVNAVVRDKKGRFVTDLSSRDFEVFDGGIARPITDFRRDEAGV